METKIGMHPASAESFSQFGNKKIEELLDSFEKSGIQVQYATLFGSMATGNPKYDGSSDIDIFVLTETDELPEAFTYLAQKGLQGGYSLFGQEDFPSERKLSSINYHLQTPSMLRSNLKLFQLNASNLLKRNIHPHRSVGLKTEPSGFTKAEKVIDTYNQRGWLITALDNGTSIPLRGELPLDLQKDLNESIDAFNKVKEIGAISSMSLETIRNNRGFELRRNTSNMLKTLENYAKELVKRTNRRKK